LRLTLLPSEASASGYGELFPSHPRPVLAGNDPKAVVLDFMQPDGAGGRSWGLDGQARLDEAGGVRGRNGGMARI
jgi:hypothetical protein